jgi:type I restriction enzyme M protein
MTTNKKSAPRKAKNAKTVPAPVAGSGYQQVFKNVDDILRKDSGCTSELDYTEQSSWLLFLKYLDALDDARAQKAKLTGKPYKHIFEAQYRWGTWAAPRKADGTPDHQRQQTGSDLLEFVNSKLFPYLRGFKERAAASNTIEYKIGEIFDEIRNRVSSGYNLRDVIDELDKLTFKSQKQKHELSDLYEVKIKNMGNAGRNGGEYYTPRPLIRAIIRVVDPKIGETIYDGACGSAGFLCEAFEYLSAKPKLTTSDLKTLQERTFYGREKKSLAYVIAVMNMILHGIDAPNVLHVNTLAQNINEIQEKDRYTVVLANPPFGGKERAEVQQNFPIKSSETAYLFLQHFIKILKAKGRAGIVIKNTFLSNTDNASIELRKHLLASCNLHTILDLPSGTFQGAGVRTVVLFFDKGTPTKKIWYYQLNPGRNFGKTNPLNDADLAEFLQLQKTKTDSANSWTIEIEDLNTDIWDLAVRNPNAEGPAELGTPAEIVAELEALDQESADLIAKLKQALS